LSSSIWGGGVINYRRFLTLGIIGFLLIGGVVSNAIKVERCKKSRIVASKNIVDAAMDDRFKISCDSTMALHSYKFVVSHERKNNGLKLYMRYKKASFLGHGTDIIAEDVFLSSQPGDWKREHLVTDPKAGDKIYIHWVYSISGSVGPFYIRVKLYTENGDRVIDFEYQPDADARKPGTYMACFGNPWVAVGGYTFKLGEIVDRYNDIDEDDESNNIASLDFTVSGEKFDIEAYDIYLSSKPGDADKRYVVNNPKAGDELYIHFKYIIWGIPDKIADPFSLRIKLVDGEDRDVINVEEEVARENRKAGYIYTLYLSREDGGGWVAPGGDYGLGGEVDIYDEVVEWDENNNLAGLYFSVTPLDEKFDMVAEQIWCSSVANDWDKKHVISPPFDPDTEMFFYFQWSIVGNPESVAPVYSVKFVLQGPGGFEFEDLVDEQDYRKANIVVRVCLMDENGNGWFAVPGDYTFTCVVDSQGDVKEWNEDNNKKEIHFSVLAEEEQWFYPPYYDDEESEVAPYYNIDHQILFFYKLPLFGSTIKRGSTLRLDLIRRLFPLKRDLYWRNKGNPHFPFADAEADKETGRVYVRADTLVTLPGVQVAKAEARIIGSSPLTKYFTVPQDGNYKITFNFQLNSGIVWIKCDPGAHVAAGESKLGGYLYEKGKSNKEYIAYCEKVLYSHVDYGGDDYHHNFANDPREYSCSLVHYLEQGKQYYFIGVLHMEHGVKTLAPNKMAMAEGELDMTLNSVYIKLLV
jgi:hypothetical protein